MRDDNLLHLFWIFSITFVFDLENLYPLYTWPYDKIPGSLQISNAFWGGGFEKFSKISFVADSPYSYNTCTPNVDAIRFQ